MGKGANVIAVAAAGFIAGMLLAPKSGKETRQDIKNKALEAKKAANEKAEHMKEHMKAGMTTFRHSAKDAGEELTDLAHSAKEHAGRVANEAKDLAVEAEQRANRVVDNVRMARDENVSIDTDRRIE